MATNESSSPPGGRQPLRVTHVVLGLDVGGLERNVVNQVRVGPETNQEVSVVCLERPGSLAPRVEAFGGRLVCLNKRPGLRPTEIGRLRAVFRDLRPDVVHTHQIGTLVYAGPAARRCGVPVVVHTEHGKERYAGRLRTRLLGRVAGTFCDRFYCLTDDMAAEIVAHRIVPKRKVRVIQNGIDTSAFRVATGQRDELRRSLGIVEGETLVGTVGRLNEIKQQHLLIRAVASLRDRGARVKLILIGDGPLMGPLRSLTTELGLDGVVHFAGYQAEPQRYLEAIDVFALTSRSEGMPQAALEASVAGIPIVASRVGGLPELIVDGESGLLFESGDEAALIDALDRLRLDPELARRLGNAGRARVESRFDITRMATDYLRDFLEILGARASPPSQVELANVVR